LSLTGNLEDLPLLDIIQIVSFSKKTGTLSIRTGEGEGGIVFHEGLVVCAFAAGTAQINPRFAAMPVAQRDGVIRSRIEIALEQLIRLREGQFSFSLAGKLPRAVGKREIALETLSSGINPQELLLNLAQGMDEDRRNSTAAVEVSFAEPEDPSSGADEVPHAPEELLDAAAESDTRAPVHSDAAVVAEFLRDAKPEAADEPAWGATIPVPIVLPGLGEPPPAKAPRPVPPTPAATPSRTILLVDDEEDVRRALAGWLQRGGYEVTEAEDPESAVKAGGRLAREGTRFVLVTDLGMPTSGGSSFQGGFEVVKRLWKMNVRPPVLMMTESLSQSLQLRARQMGIKAFVFKPGLSKLNPRQFEADLQAFAEKIVADVLPKLAASSSSAERPVKKAGAPSGGPAEPATVSPGEEELSQEFSFLQRRLAELRQPGNANQVAILVVKVAREFFERGILFLVKNDEARGLGGFGLAPRGESLNLLARQVVLPLGEPSPLQEVVQHGRPFVGPLPADRWSNHLMGRIGRFQAGTIALLPLVAHRETIAVLYGDNPESGRELPRLPGLELFVHQAGIVLENTFLQRKLQSLQEKG
jgi:CheY-like chemotaxis protein